MIPIPAFLAARAGLLFGGVAIKLLIGAGVFLYIVYAIQAKAVLEREIDLAADINRQFVADIERRDKLNAAQETRHQAALDRLADAEARAAANRAEIVTAAAQDEREPSTCPINCLLP